MDPQKNASNPAPFPGGQVPLSAQDDGQPKPSAAQPAQNAPQEVTVDFSQGQETTPAESSRPGGLNNMPSITPEVPAPGAMPPVNDGLNRPADSQASAPFGGAPAGQPLQPQDPFAAQQPAQPGAFPLAGGPAPQGGFDTPPNQPAQPGQPFGDQAPGLGQPQSPVPPVAPVPGIKNDKKTIIILAVVAVVLIVAIAVLVFV
jgi:hypothetical protein